MSDLRLKSLDISNFRSLRGQIHAPLDASVVLVHGENGAGKTSLLSAIELALTGRVQSFERADPGYGKQLLHRLAGSGRVSLEAVAGTVTQRFETELTASGARSISALDGSLADFFRERAFLPQSLLGQLLQIYQEAGNHATSPLAQFVGKLLGLDKLDAIEAGLKPFADVRNVRKHVDGWLAVENERSRRDSRISDLQQLRMELEREGRAVEDQLAMACAELGFFVEVGEATLDTMLQALHELSDFQALAQMADRQRELASILREIDAAQKASGTESIPPASANAAAQAYANWDAEHGTRMSELRVRIESVLPGVSLPSEPEDFAQAALRSLVIEHKQLTDRVSQAREESHRYVTAKGGLATAVQRLGVVDEELLGLTVSASGLGEALAELTAFIDGTVCPVCERDFSEVGDGALADHVHAKVQRISASAERLLALGRTRSEEQAAIDRWTREIEAITARRIGESELVQLDRRLAVVGGSIDEIKGAEQALRDGVQLRAADVAVRRTITAAQSRDTTLAAARETLSEFALSIDAAALEEGESFFAAGVRLKDLLTSQSSALQGRVAVRTKAIDQVASVRATAARRRELADRISEEQASRLRTDQALTRAQSLREDSNAIRCAVDNVRSAIIRREFNDHLNRLWRDLFVRLAPGEPFVPAFRIPESATQNLQPKLITVHRDGGVAGGTPGAMLSAGNLNTAALTLFTALHLSVPKELPWLILDDPVQSMDDVHIAHFAALLRTLSKEHGRQVVLAVHDRQLFEYLKLELSPAFPEDSLLTLELSRGARRDSLCVSTRYSYQEETALLAA